MNGWAMEKPDRWVRSDGAVVVQIVQNRVGYWQARDPYGQLVMENANAVHRFPTARQAMAEVDRRWPL